MSKADGRSIGNFSSNGQVLMMYCCLTYLSKSDFLLQASFAKLMYTEILCQAQALPKCHAIISVPLVM